MVAPSMPHPQHLYKFEDYPQCGLLEQGFLRIKCDGCRYEPVVAFSCKLRRA